MAKAKKAAVAVEELSRTNPEEIVSQLSGLNYNNLRGEDFETYTEVEKTLLHQDAYYFEVYKVAPVLEKIFDKDLNKVDKLVGIQLKNSTPIYTTKVEVKHALEMNRQIMSEPSRAGLGRYFLLKK
jgi:hypothetical protein